MPAKCARLDRFVSVKTGINRKHVRSILAQGRLKVDGNVATEIHQLVDEFAEVVLDDQVLQAKTPVYIMMNKPMSVVSATKDAKNKTVIDVLNKNLEGDIDSADLHIVGRLDFNTTGLLLLTNDGRWSRLITAPEQKIVKHYRVTLGSALDESYIGAFAEGMYFPYENITTKPVRLEIINEYVADVSLTEGRYHQIKRMFGRFQNPVVALHRTAIGDLLLDGALAVGEHRLLTTAEVVKVLGQ